MRSSVLAVLALAGCGRLAFDPLAEDAALADGVPDAPPADLLLYLRFDVPGLVHDDVSDRDVACVGACPTATDPRLGGSAALFTGTECLDVGAFTPAALTLSAWVRHGTPTGTHEIVGRALDGATSDANSLELYLSGALWATSADRMGVAAPFTADVWQHLAVTHDGTTIRLYLDGALTGEVDGPLVFGAQDRWQVGCDRNLGTYDEHALGTIDDIRIYGRALAASEIAALATP